MVKAPFFFFFKCDVKWIEFTGEPHFSGYPFNPCFCLYSF